MFLKRDEITNTNSTLKRILFSHLVRVPADSPLSSSSSASSSEPSIAKSTDFKPPFPVSINNGSPPSTFSGHPLYGSAAYSPFNCLSSNNNNSNNNGINSSLREHNNDQQQQQQQQQILLHDRLLQIAAASRQQQQQLSFDGHGGPPNGLWRPNLRSFLGRLLLKVFLYCILIFVKYIEIRSAK